MPLANGKYTRRYSKHIDVADEAFPGKLDVETSKVSREARQSVISADIDRSATFRKRIGLYGAAVSCLLSSISTGMVLGYTAPAGPKMELATSRIVFNDDTSSWFGSIAPLGALIGGLAGGPFSDRFGRKTSIILSGVPCFIGWLLIAYGSVIPVVLVGRFITGFFCGLTCAVAPQYLMEISTLDTRGFLGASFQLCIVTGVLLSSLVGAGIGWSWLAVASTAPVIFMMATMVFMPESPQWLLTQKRIKEAVESAVFLHGKGDATAAEMEAVSTHPGQSKKETQFQFSLLKERGYYLPSLYSLALMFFQQFCGINAVIFYTTDIFKSSGAKIDAMVATIIVDVIQVVATFIGSILMDRAGRRLLLLVSGLGISVALLVLGIFYALDEHIGKSFTEQFGWMGVVCLSMMVAFFSIGYGPIPWMIISEIVPQRAKGIVSGVATGFNWACVFIITKTFKAMIRDIHSDGTYWFYCAVAIGSCVFTWFCIPETKGKSLDEIAEGFVRKKGSISKVDSSMASLEYSGVNEGQVNVSVASTNQDEKNKEKY